MLAFSLPLFADGTAPGTVIWNGDDHGTVGLDDSPGDVICTYQNGPAAGKTSNEVSVEVSTGYAAGVAISPLSASVLQGNATYYPLRITNRANVPDTMTFSVAVSSQLWPTGLFLDTNGDGIHQSGETTPAGSSTGLLAPDASFAMFLYVSVPSTAAADQVSIARITVQNQNGTGTEDHWRNDGNDTIVVNVTTMLDGTPPVVVYSSGNPAGAIGVLGNRVVIAARVADPESGITSVDLHYRIDASTFVAAMSYSSGTCTLELGSLITRACTLVYSVHAANGAGLVTVAPAVTCTFGTQTSGGQISSGRVEVEDGNPDDGNTSLTIPAGALTSSIALTFTQESTAAVTSASGGLAETAHPASAFEIGPSGTIFAKPATLTILYYDLDNDGREDSTGQDEKTLRVFWWDGIAWRYLGGEVDAERNTVTVPVMHFSLFAVFPAKAPAPEDLRPKEKIITPNGDKVNDYAAFGLTGEFTVKIFNANGRLIRTLDGKNIWDGKDDAGDIVESGAYIYQFKADGKLISGIIVVAK